MATLIINGLSTVVFPLRVLGTLLERVETIDLTLDEMEPGSDFLQELAASNDPGIPYTVIAGNTSLITGSPDTLKGKLVARLKSLMKLPFYGVPNDLAVTVESIKAIPTGRHPAPVMVDVDCDHLVYFTDKSGIKALGTSIASILTGGASNQLFRDEDLLLSKPIATKHSSSFKVCQFQYQIIWWILGVILLILIGFVGFQLANRPQTNPSNPQSLLHSADV